MLSVLTWVGWQHEATAKAVAGSIAFGLFLGLAWRAAVNVQRHGFGGLWHTLREPLGDGTFTAVGLAWALLAVLSIAACVALASRWGWLPARIGYRSSSPFRRRYWWRRF